MTTALRKATSRDEDEILALLDALRQAHHDKDAAAIAAAYADEAAAALVDLPPIASAGAGRGREPGGRTAGGAGRSRPRRRHAEVTEPQPGWVPTSERFRDPSSGMIMRVWTDPADGSRYYVPDNSPA